MDKWTEGWNIKKKCQESGFADLGTKGEVWTYDIVTKKREKEALKKKVCAERSRD